MVEVEAGSVYKDVVADGGGVRRRKEELSSGKTCVAGDIIEKTEVNEKDVSWQNAL